MKRGEILDEILQSCDIAVAGPKLPGKVENVAKSFLQQGNEPSKSAAEKHKTVLIPEGLEDLNQTRVNERIYQLMSRQAKIEACMYKGCVGRDSIGKINVTKRNCRY